MHKIKDYLLWSEILILTFVFLGYANSQDLSLLSNKHNAFISEVNNELWVASCLTGFNRIRGFDKLNYRLNDPKYGLKGSVIQSKIYEDSTGKLWTSTYENLCVFDFNLNKFNCFQLTIGNKIIKHGYHIFGLIETDLYVRVGDQIIIYDVKKNIVSLELGKTYGNSFTMTSQSIIAANWNNKAGFEIWSLKNNEWIKELVDFYFCQNEISNCIVRNTLKIENRIFLLTNIGLILFDSKMPCNSKLYGTQDDFENIISGCIIEDFLILSNENKGLSIFDLKTNSYLAQIGNKGNDIVLSATDLFEISISNQSENLWLCYTNNGVEKLKWQDIKQSIINGPFKNRRIKELLFKSRIFIEVDETNIVINENAFASQSNLVTVKYNIEGNLISAYFKGKNDLIALCEDHFLEIDLSSRKQNVLVPNLNSGFKDLQIFNDSIYLNANFNVYKSPDLDIDFEEYKLEKYKNEIQRFGPFTKTIKSFILSSSKFWIKSSSVDTLLDIGAYLNKVTYDSLQQNFYCATNSGLFQIDSTYTVTKLSKKPWEIDNKTVSEIEYHDGYVYMSVEQQLARYNVETGETRFFTQDRFEHTPVFAIQDSVIHVAEKYVTTYDIDEAFVDTNRYELKFDELKVNREVWNHRTMDLSDGLDLKHTQNEVAFKYYTNNWHNADLSSVRYKLLPHYPDWTYADNGTEIEFPFLPPDDYQYVVQGILPSGEMTEMKTFDFDINPPWWRTTWFYTIAGLSLAALLYLLYRYRVKQITSALQIENEMNQLEKSALQAQMNPHFIFNCLNSIQGFIMDNDKEQAMEYLSKFAKLIRLNLNASVDSSIRLDQEILILENYLSLEQLRASDSFQYEISTDAGLIAQDISIPPMLIQPFVENAVIHGMKGMTADGKIAIRFSKSDNLLVVDVIDNGVGDQKNKLSNKRRSLGMSITQKRLAHINKSKAGDYAIEQLSIGQGKHIRVRIKY